MISHNHFVALKENPTQTVPQLFTPRRLLEFFFVTHKVINKMAADSKGKHSSICCCLSGIASSRILTTSPNLNDLSQPGVIER